MAEEVRRDIEHASAVFRAELADGSLSCENRTVALDAVRELLRVGESLREVFQVLGLEDSHPIEDREGEEWNPDYNDNQAEAWKHA